MDIAPFADNDFDSGKFVRNLLDSPRRKPRADASAAPLHSLVHSTSEVEDFLQDLNLQLSRVEKTLHHHVIDNKDDLLTRLSNVSMLFSDIKQVKAGVTMLKASTQRIRRDFLTPMDNMRAQTRKLARIQQASRLMRQTSRVLSLSQTLRQEIGKFEGVAVTATGSGAFEISLSSGSAIDDAKSAKRTGDDDSTRKGAEARLDDVTSPTTANKQASIIADLPKAATLLYDIEHALSASRGLKRISMVATQTQFFKQAGDFVRIRAASQLEKAVLNFEQNDISRALQVFFNLKGLPEAIAKVIESISSQVSSTVAQKLDVRELAHEASALSGRKKGGTSITSSSKKGKDQGLMPQSGQVKIWKRLLWERFDVICEQLHQSSLQMWTLQRILSKKRDPLTHENFLALVATDQRFRRPTTERAQAESAYICDPDQVGTVYSEYWNTMTSKLAATLLSLARKFSFVKNIFVREYPVLRERLESVLRRLQQSTEIRAKIAEHTSIGSSKAEHRLLVAKTTSPFLKVYLARSSARMNAAINIMGTAPNGKEILKKPTGNRNLSIGLPSTKAMMTFVDCVRDEIRAVRHDTGLSVAVTRSVVKSVRSVLEGLEAAWCTHPDGYTFDMLTFRRNSVVEGNQSANDGTGARRRKIGSTKSRDSNRGDGLNSFQNHNCKLAELLSKLGSGLRSLVNGLENELGASQTMLDRASAWERKGDISRRGQLLSQVNADVERLRDRILASFWGGLSKSAEAILASMHLEHYGGRHSKTVKPSDRTGPLSNYMQKLVRAIDTLFATDGFPMHSDKEDANMLYRLLAAHRVTGAFVKHVSLVRPLGEKGRSILRCDAEALKNVVSQLAFGESKLQQDDHPLYAELNAVTTIFLQDRRLASSDVFGHPLVCDGTVRPSICFHRMLARAPPELQLPHRREGWSQSWYMVCVQAITSSLYTFATDST